MSAPEKPVDPDDEHTPVGEAFDDGATRETVGTFAASEVSTEFDADAIGEWEANLDLPNGFEPSANANVEPALPPVDAPLRLTNTARDDEPTPTKAPRGDLLIELLTGELELAPDGGQALSDLLQGSGSIELQPLSEELDTNEFGSVRTRVAPLAELAEIVRGSASPQVEAGRGDASLTSRPVAGARLDFSSREEYAFVATSGDFARPHDRSPSEQRQLAAWLQAERSARTDAAERGTIDLWLGQTYEALGQSDDAKSAYKAASTAPDKASAFAGLRRVAERGGEISLAVDAIAHEVASADEATWLAQRRAELQLALGNWDAPKFPAANLTAGWLAFIADAAREETPLDALTNFRTAAAELGEPQLAGALALQLARFSTFADRKRDVAAQLARAMAADSAVQSAAGFFALVHGESLPTADFAPLLEAVEGTHLGVALRRRVLEHALSHNEIASAEALLDPLLQPDDDLLVLRTHCDLLARCDRPEEQRALLVKWVELESDRGSRADVLVRLGEREEASAQLEAAQAAYERAEREDDSDLRAARGLQRLRVLLQDEEFASARYLTEAEREADPIVSARLTLLAAQSMLDSGRGDAAFAKVIAALEIDPADWSGVELACSMHLAAGRSGAAAGLLLKAASGARDPILTQVYRERAVRLLAIAGRVREAVIEARTLQTSSFADYALWLAEWASIGDGALHANALAEHAESYTTLGNESGRALAALLWLERARITTPGKAFAENGGDNGDASAAFTKAAQLVPSSALISLAARLHFSRKGQRAERLGLVSAHRDAVAADHPAWAANLTTELAINLESQSELPAARDALMHGAHSEPLLRMFAFRLAAQTNALPELIELVRWQLADLPEGSDRASFELMLGALQEELGQADDATATYHRAQKDRAPLASRALELLWWRRRRASDLAELYLARLRADNTPTERVRTFELMARLDASIRNDPQSAQLSLRSALNVEGGFTAAVLANVRLQAQAAIENDRGELVRLLSLLQSHVTGAEFLQTQWHTAMRLSGSSDETMLNAAFAAGSPRAIAYRLAGAEAHPQRAGAYDLIGALLPHVDPAATIYLQVRAIEALCLQGYFAEAAALASAELVNDPYLVREKLGLDLGIGQNDWALAGKSGVRLSQLLRGEQKQRSWLITADITERHLHDNALAIAQFGYAFALVPTDDEAFERLATLLRSEQRHAELVDVLDRKKEVERDELQRVRLHYELAGVYVEHLQNPARAEAELLALLALSPDHKLGLDRLADVYTKMEAWDKAADILERRAAKERSRRALRVLFLRLADIYKRIGATDKIKSAYTRMLQINPSDVESIERLTELHLELNDDQSAVRTLQRLLQLTTEPAQRLQFIVKLEQVLEVNLHDPQGALRFLRALHEQSPADLGIIRELVALYERIHDRAARRVLLDLTSTRVRAQIESAPMVVEHYHSLFQVFVMGNLLDRAAITASVIEHFGDLQPEERNVLRLLRERDNHAGITLNDSGVDEILFTPDAPLGLRNFMRVLREPLAKLYRADEHKLALGRKLDQSHALYNVARAVANDLKIDDFQIYICSARPNAYELYPLSQPTLVIGEALIENAHEDTLYVLVGGLCKLIASDMLLPYYLPSDSLGALVFGVAHHFAPTFQPVGFTTAQLQAEGTRVSRAAGKRMSEAMPFALECASESFHPAAIAGALLETALRAGAFASGVPEAALQIASRLSGVALLTRLRLFFISEEYAELRRLAGISIDSE